MRKIDSIFIHYTDSPEVSLSAVNYWHLLAFPENPDPYTGLFISYHHVIHQTGWVEAGRDERSVGWHVKGYNSRSIGIVLTGSDGMDWYPAPEQYASLQALLRDLMRRFSISPERIYFHRDKNATSCPGRLDKTKILKLLGQAPEPEKEEEDDMGSTRYCCQNPKGEKSHPRVGLLNTMNKREVWVGVNFLMKNPPKGSKIAILIKPNDRDVTIKKILKPSGNRETNFMCSEKIKEEGFSLTARSPDGLPFAMTVVQD